MREKEAKGEEKERERREEDIQHGAEAAKNKPDFEPLSTTELAILLSIFSHHQDKRKEPGSGFVNLECSDLYQESPLWISK